MIMPLVAFVDENPVSCTLLACLIPSPLPSSCSRKSSIVRTISSGTPEVNNYPFTTRGMTLGHVEVFWSDNSQIAKAAVPDERRKPGSMSQEVLMGKYAFSQLCQVMDSPGLLLRPDDDGRNEMEALTLAAMQHLPTAVIYVLDLTGEAGDKFSSVQDQLQLRRQVRKWRALY